MRRHNTKVHPTRKDGDIVSVLLQLPNGFEIFQRDDVLKVTDDAVELAAFADPPGGAAVCDLGAGAGAVTLLMAHRTDLTFTAVEMNEAAYGLLVDSVKHNGLEARVTPLHGDLRELPRPMNDSFGAVVCNPPYLKWDGREEYADPERSDKTAPPDALCASAERLLRIGGRFYLVIRPDRLVDYLYELRRHGLEPKRLKFAGSKSAPSLALIEARKGAGVGLVVERGTI